MLYKKLWQGFLHLNILISFVFINRIFLSYWSIKYNDNIYFGTVNNLGYFIFAVKDKEKMSDNSNTEYVYFSVYVYFYICLYLYTQNTYDNEIQRFLKPNLKITLIYSTQCFIRCSLLLGTWPFLYIFRGLKEKCKAK